MWYTVVEAGERVWCQKDGAMWYRVNGWGVGLFNKQPVFIGYWFV